ncbi:hypothetical protein [Rhodopseudomonas sp. P2A-2r]|uniref:hypothetical protein n=1 Tax=unclassified Rhodopseudomonas TaxID=2638247 RepID=UPI002233FF13|nr:hypothetical protein [Rhodopseudomonas sp. P2A-2r]UZE48398.1 hypothetical protein ONR75_26930 [Rhodopseudomonas sp. P2A-2r]
MWKFPILAALLVAAPVAKAAPLMAPDALRPAIAAASNVETVACVRYGWRGVGVYPGCYRPRYAMAAPYYVAPPVYVAPPAYVPPPRRCWYAGAWRRC